MAIHEFILISDYDGLEIGCLLSSPDGEVRAVLQISHGMCGCKERYIPFVRYMASKGVVCVVNDHRGHGDSVRSSDDYGYMYEGGYSALVSDMNQLTSYARSLFPDVPFFLLGHSMGSLAAILYAGRWSENLSGLILCGIPYYMSPVKASSLMMRCLCALGGERMKMPYIQRLSSHIMNRRFRNEGEQAWVCSDPDVRNDFMNNSKCNFSFTANGFHNLMSMLSKAYSPDIWKGIDSRFPVLMLSGADDPCTSYGKSLQMMSDRMRKAGLKDIGTEIFPEMRHELLNERGKELVWEKICMFIRIFF